jgi:hypothetical protein
MERPGRPVIYIETLADPAKSGLLIPSLNRTGNAEKFFSLVSKFAQIKKSSNSSKDLITNLKEISQLLDESLGGRASGLNVFQQFKTDISDLKVLFTHLTSLFDRHVFFYRTYIYFPEVKYFYEWASPWISASLSPSQAHKFTFAGFASDRLHNNPRMQWLHIYKVRIDNYYNAELFQRGKPLKLSDYWFDERSLTRHPYALEELALNKLGTPDPDEYEALLYLGEIEPASELLALLKTKDDEIANKKSQDDFFWKP